MVWVAGLCWDRAVRGEGGCVRVRGCKSVLFGCESAAVCTSMIQTLSANG